jgi:hypothetical protein
VRSGPQVLWFLRCAIGFRANRRAGRLIDVCSVHERRFLLSQWEFGSETAQSAGRRAVERSLSGRRETPIWLSHTPTGYEPSRRLPLAA